ncbi:hypothetical protein MKW92_048984 [Papaver armeniacum]|nr:hypothetical protein MKW92_048984 [Papaver armeniacum]
METVIPKVILSSGSVMPILGMGTASFPPVDPVEARIAILNSTKVGYRHFDTAAAYQSEEFLGEAIAEALQLGLIKSRDELFITSKLWCTDAHPELVVPAIQNSFRNLKLEYLDLYLIHFPASLKPGKFEKSVGVSNFSCKKLQIILDTANIPPAVNQVEMNPLWQNLKLREFCKTNDIFVTGYSPLGASGTPWGSDGVKDAQVLYEIAQARNKTHAQVCLRWVYEQGVGLLVKSFNEQRMEENLMIFDWQLAEDDLVKISKLPQRRCHPSDLAVSELPGAPFKTVEELWDGESGDVPVINLSSGREMPILGMGTAENLLEGSERVKSALVKAIEVGYRHFDTASMYQTEESLGEAVAEALQLGLIKSRHELFITSKLYLKPGEIVPNVQKDELLPMNYKSVWAAMEECQMLGLTKSIGVSNFSCKILQELMDTATIPPAVNQVSLRWVYEQGVSLLMKSYNEERMKENLKIFDWELTAEDLNAISELPQRRIAIADVLVSANGPFKSLEELWDNEL